MDRSAQEDNIGMRKRNQRRNVMLGLGISRAADLLPVCHIRWGKCGTAGKPISSASNFVDGGAKVQRQERTFVDHGETGNH